jgi:hypothetical protein
VTHGAERATASEKREKQKKKRDFAKQRARSAGLAPSLRELVRLAGSAAFGPVWVSKNALSDDESELVTVVITREIPAGQLLSETILVDRTCLGVKNAFVTGPMDDHEAQDGVAVMEARGILLVRCEPAFAQSVVFHAIEYARSLGFEPHRDLELALVEPRPAPLVETPLARPARPVYISGPFDDARRVVARLDATVGPGNYDFISAGKQLLEWDGEDDEWDEDVEEDGTNSALGPP